VTPCDNPAVPVHHHSTTSICLQDGFQPSCLTPFCVHRQDMTGRCHECGEETFWDDALGSSVCMSCGTLADPSQNVLASHLESFNNSGREDPTWTPGNPTLKSIRNNNGWALSGQGKEAQARQNTVCICSAALAFDVSKRQSPLFVTVCHSLVHRHFVWQAFKCCPVKPCKDDI